MMQLDPLSSRLAMSLVRSLTIFFIIASMSHKTQAENYESDPIPFLEESDLVAPIGDRSALDPTYQPEFSLFDRSIIGRAPPGVTGLLDNVRENRNVVPGAVQSFVFEASRIWGRASSNDDGITPVLPRGFNETWGPQLMGAEERDTSEGEDTTGTQLQRRRSKVIYISATTCLQPQRKPNNTEMDPPQLTLFVSTSDNNTTPGPGQDMSTQDFIPFDEGAATIAVNATEDVYFGISAPTSNLDWFDGDWNFDVAVSTDQFYHTYDESPSSVLWVDSDSTAALLQTPNLTDSSDATKIQQVMSAGPQFIMYVENEKGWATRGVRHSMCGLNNYAQMAAKSGGLFGDKATTIMTTRGPGGLPKQQFHFNGLNASSSYLGILAHTGLASRKRQFENRAGGGGQVFQAVQFETKTGTSLHDEPRVYLALTRCRRQLQDHHGPQLLQRD